MSNNGQSTTYEQQADADMQEYNEVDNADEVDEEVDDNNGVVQYSPTNDEQQCIVDYCRELFTYREFRNQVKEKKKEYMSERKKHAETLEQYMNQVDRTCIPLSIGDKEVYLRAKFVNTSKSVNPTTLKEALEKINYDLAFECHGILQQRYEEDLKKYKKDIIAWRKRQSSAETGADKKKKKASKSNDPIEEVADTEPQPPTKPQLIHVLRECVVQSSKNVCNSKRMQIELSASKERKKRTDEEKKKKPTKKDKEREAELEQEFADSVPDTVKREAVELLKCMKKLSKVNSKMSEKREQFSKCVGNPSMTPKVSKKKKQQEESEPVSRVSNTIANYLQRVNPTKKSTKINLFDNKGQGHDYYLRYKTSVKKGTFRMTDLPVTAEASIKKHFEVLGVDVDTPFNNEIVDQCLNDEKFREALLTLISNGIEEKRKSTSTVETKISVDKAKTGNKRKRGSILDYMYDNAPEDEVDDDEFEGAETVQEGDGVDGVDNVDEVEEVDGNDVQDEVRPQKRPRIQVSVDTIPQDDDSDDEQEDDQYDE